MDRIHMLDCTLRDGGCVNNFNFGESYMKQILHSIESAGIEIIEVGYIDSKSGSEAGRTQYCNDKVISDNFLKKKKENTTYVAMIDYGKYDPELLQTKNEKSIDGIRLAFHKKDRKNMLNWGRKILEKGYQLYIQPMTCLRYSDEEMLDLISDVNNILPDASAFYIVDSFGEMRLKEMNRIANLIDHNLNANISLGLHSHNNLQLSYSNAVTLLNFQTNRTMIFDASIMGMGKGAGNMNSELFADHLNEYEGKKYNIEALLEIIDKVINQIKTNYNWGYSVEYYLSANNHCTPSYAAHFYKKHMLTIPQVSELLEKISEEKKVSFDKEYADRLYYEYNAHNYDDEVSINKLKKAIRDKKILIIAPGKSVLLYEKEIKKYIGIENPVTIALNNRPTINCDYSFVTKEISYEVVRGMEAQIIATSNVPIKDEEMLIVNYEALTHYTNGISDNSTIMLINLLLKCEIKGIALAGFDGFSTLPDDNYYEEALKRPIDIGEVETRNNLITEYLKSIGTQIDIKFLTPSKYQV
jgi:4-hydroxy 2-oxovalerate aldolase